MSKTISVFKRQQGVSLLELMLSLAIIAIILNMATMFYRQTNEARKTNEAYQATIGLIAAVDNWKAANPGAKYSALTTSSVGGFFPADYMPPNDYVFDGARLAISGGNVTISGLPDDVNCGLSARVQHVLDGKAQVNCSTAGTLSIAYIDKS